MNVGVGEGASQQNLLLNSWTESFLTEFGLALPKGSLEQSRFVDFSSQRIFDRDMTVPLPRVDFIGDRFGPGAKAYYEDINHSGEAVPVLSSGTIPLLTAAGYEGLTSFDMVGLLATNEVMMINKKAPIEQMGLQRAQGHLLGNYLLRDTLREITKELGPLFKVVRLRGDQFAVYAKKGTLVNTTVEGLDIVIEEATERSSRLRRDENDTVVFEPASVRKTELKPLASQHGYVNEIHRGALDKRKKRLIELHPELKGRIAAIDDNVSESERNHYYTYLEDTHFDDLLENVVSEWQAKGYSIDSYRDKYDFEDHLLHNGPVPHSGMLIKIEFPGVAKRLNDDKRFGNEFGDLFITEQELPTLLKTLEKRNDIHGLKIRRQGIDMYLYLPYLSSSPTTLISDIKKAFPIQYHAKNGEAELSVPLLPVVGLVPLNNTETSASQFDQNMENAYRDLEDQTEADTFREKRNYYLSPLPDKTDWEDLGYYMNPYSKRHVRRSRLLNLDGVLTHDLRQFYRKSNDRRSEPVFDPSRIEEFKIFMKQFFQSVDFRKVYSGNYFNGDLLKQ